MDHSPTLVSSVLEASEIATVYGFLAEEQRGWTSATDPLTVMIPTVFFLAYHLELQKISSRTWM